MRRSEPFFVVWCPTHGAPTVRHGNRAAALIEATRLARSNPGKEFFVLAASARVVRNDVSVEDFDLEIPF
jgi:hypothetical protein